MTEAVQILVPVVEAARMRLASLAVEGGASAPQAACDLGRAVGIEIAEALADMKTSSPVAHAAARAAGERFDSHILAASLLEASDASTASIFDLVGRGLAALSDDLERLAEARRLPA